MSYDVIQQTLIEHNEKWKQKNERIRESAERLHAQGHNWRALIQMAGYDESESKRLQLWASTLREYFGGQIA